MANFINITETRPIYGFLDAKCIGRTCFHPVNYGGIARCNNRALRGCPDPLPVFDKELARLQKAQGWRLKK